MAARKTPFPLLPSPVMVMPTATRIPITERTETGTFMQTIQLNATEIRPSTIQRFTPTVPQLRSRISIRATELRSTRILPVTSRWRIIKLIDMATSSSFRFTIYIATLSMKLSEGLDTRIITQQTEQESLTVT